MNVIPEYVMDTANVKNNWFTIENIKKAAHSWSLALKKDKVEKWLEHVEPSADNKTVGIIMAGNIPFVGLHDLLSAVASGRNVYCKLSSQDEVLMGHAILNLTQILPELSDKIAITENLKGIDYLIATGSNNSARYFEHYFKNIPCLIRKNRTSVSVLDGTETAEELTALSDDIYQYFGLGCRNITHLLLPRQFELKPLYEAYDKYIDIVNHHKYYNNYMYHKSILLMNLTKHYDNGFMLFQEKTDLHAPISTLNYHLYDDISEAQTYLKERENDIQCVVSHSQNISGALPFGQSQMPELWDYADGVNTLEFLR